MRKYLLPQVLLIALLSATVLSQSSNQSQSVDRPVKLAVTLVQVDAIVTDSHGHQVTNLRPEDFQVSIHGRQQRITSFSYEHFGHGGVTPAAAANSDGTGLPASESSRTATTSPRVLAFVVDDLLSSFDSIVRTKLLLHQFINEKMEPGDKVAIAHTGGGIGALQSFTSDTRLLHQTVDRLNWNPIVLGRLHAGEAMESSGLGDIDAMVARAQGEIDRLRHEVFSAGTLGALTFLVRQLKVLPGRKSLVLVSDGFRLPGTTSLVAGPTGFPLPVSAGDDSLLDEPLRRLVDLANRASVSVYTIHTPGLQYLGLGAADSFTSPDSIAAANRASDRQLEFALSQQGLAYLAKETGGFAVQNRNDLGQGLDRILNDESGYYLIGFVPDDRTFRRDGGFPVFNEIRIKVKQPGLTIRHRKGFYSIPEKERVLDTSPRASLYDTLISPIGADQIDLRVTSLFASDPKTGSFIRSLLHLDARNLTFADDGDGWHKASFDVVAVTFGQDGEATVNGNRTETLRVRGPEYEHLLRHGLVYTLNLPVKRPGFYQLRVAVRDAASERIGSATQFIEAPDLSTGRLTLSGIALMSGPTGKPQPPAVAAPEAGASVASEPNDDANESAAIRLFHTGEDVALGLVIFNARGASDQDKPNLTLQTRIYRDGKLVNAGPVSNLNPAGTGDWRYVAAHGTLHLGGLQPGQYSLEVICREKPLKGKSRVATQWTDFEIGGSDSFQGSRAGDAREVAGIKLCWCPPGRFRMGSPPDELERRPDEAQVDVTLTKGFWMGKYEATQGEWKRVVGKLPGELTLAGGEGDDFPVYNVNYAEAVDFCRKVTELAHKAGDLPEGWEFRLPTEAQWEYACRAGTTTATAFGDKISSKQANFQGKPYNGAEPGPSLMRATRVGSYPPNAWGLHDMHGNVVEWCRDWYHARLPGGVDPDLSSVIGTPNRDGTYSRSRRGSAFTDDGWASRSAFRQRFEPERRYDHIGFRVAAVNL